MKLFEIFKQQRAMPATVSGFGFVGNGLGIYEIKQLPEYIKQGYVQNPVVRACVQMIALGAGSVKLEVHKKLKDGVDIISEHPLLELLERPNPTQTGAAFIQELMTYHRIAGEAFILRLPSGNGAPIELYNLDPRHVKVEESKGGLVPVAYCYGDGENKKRYPVDVDGNSQVKHIKTVNPINPWRGLSPIASCSAAVDMHNQGGMWNAKLLENSARPSGIVSIENAPDEGAISRIKEHFKRAWQGSDNAGGIPVLTGGAKFEAMSHNPKDMDFKTSMTEAAKQIAMVYGVPLPLVSTEASTYSNLAEAKESLWADTIIPLLDEVLNALGDFLLPLFDKRQTGQTILTFNPDSIPALEAKRTRLFERMAKAVSGGLLTPNEARSEMGFEEVDGADELLIGTSTQTLSSLPSSTASLIDTMKRAGMKAADIADVLAEK